MPLSKLQRSFEERRQNLIDTLQKAKGDLPLSKQHQLYGAIKEIENFLKAIDYHRDQVVSAQDFELKREAPHPLVQRTRYGLRRVGYGCGLLLRGVVNVLFKGPARAMRRFRKRMGMYRQALRELERRS